jgi:hypothetical protein
MAHAVEAWFCQPLVAVAGQAAAMKSLSMIEVPTSAMEAVVLGDIGVVVVDNRAVVPVGFPVVPSPTEASEDTDPKS